MSSDNVVTFRGVTKLDLPADRVLKAAVECGLTGVIIAGYTEDGSEYFASSYADGGDALWLAERFKVELMRYGES